MDQHEMALQRLKDRIKLQSRGILVHPRKEGKPINHMQSYYGGAGPLGRKYYICYSENETPSTMASLAVYPEDHYLAGYAVKTRRSERDPHALITEDGVVLKGVARHNFKDTPLEDGPTPREVGLLQQCEMHCYDTLTFTMWMWCSHLNKNQQCKYCTIDAGVRKWKLQPRPTDERFMGVLRNAATHDHVRSVTITSGNYDAPDQVVKEYLEFVPKLKSVANLPIHVQFPPLSDVSLLEDLAEHVDSVGVFLEIFDEKIRKEICPGKGKVPRERYFETWEEAVRIFGRGKVLTTCILGFGEDFDSLLPEIERCIDIGVRVIILHVRVGSPYLPDNFVPSYVGKDEELLDFHLAVAEAMVRNNIDLHVRDVSGCTGCQACSAMAEACHYVRLTQDRHVCLTG